MKPKEFFEQVKKSLNETETTSDPLGCDFFIVDMEELFEKWRLESENEQRKL